jgi:hypothetical protein
LKTGGGSGVGGGTYCARDCAIKTQAPKTTADPLNKSCAGVIRSNLLVGIAVSFTGDVLLPLIDHTGAKLSFAKPLETAYSASDKSPTRSLRQQAAAPVHRFSRFCNIHSAAHGGQAARGRRALAPPEYPRIEPKSRLCLYSAGRQENVREKLRSESSASRMVLVVRVSCYRPCRDFSAARQQWLQKRHDWHGFKSRAAR